MRRVRSTVAIGLLAGGLAWWLGERPATEPQTSAARETVNEGTSEFAVGPVEPSEAVQVSSAREPASIAPGLEVSLSAKTKDSLLEFEKTKKIVLATSTDDEEKQRQLKERMFQDASLMRELELLLKAPAMGNHELASQQMTALDVLFDAMNSKSADLAEKVLAAVVEDRTIEDESLDSNRRQALAEVKAEVLYRWSAAEPGQVDQIVGMLPGPVSQKIWGNVIETQEQNAAESILEATNRGMTRSTEH
ncbi:MAG: hypothetical protein JNJ49_15830 [Bdellovibrionaceae bacterium]|nr:hypothetical protein [Pseudobdellovibrionaceae bacterium]